jgi:hypothetical protein
MDCFLAAIVCRKTEWDKMFAEGMSRAIRKMEKGNWGAIVIITTAPAIMVSP